MEEIDRIRRRLREAGATDAQLRAAADLDALYQLSGDVGNRPAGDAMSLREVAAASGVDLQVAAGFLHAAGLVATDVDAPVWYSSDVEWMRSADAARALFGDEAVLALLRRAGGAMSQLANAASSVFRVNLAESAGVVAPMEVIERNLATRPLVDTFLDVLSQLYRYHSRLSFREEAVAAGTFGELRRMSVGFVDLASSTQLGSVLSATELARAVNDFNAVAYGIATRHGVRVVKTIGDEAMLCALGPAAVCRAALDLVEYCADHETFAAARGAVTTGDVLEQEGDCYGPVVNRAARFVEAAPDGAVMVDAMTAAALGEGFAVAAVEPVEHRGIGSVPWSTVDRLP